ncbi:hypothetical protein [Streptomyces sp. NPDC048606]|uniref:hypothetical protein n=1 Tax=Streptomyces sp. NPDC048606 TaxID=3154726 RepID=UPI00343A683E
MIDTIGETVVGHLVDRGMTALGPGLVFWTGGGLAWLSAHGGPGELKRLAALVQELPVLAVIVLVAMVFIGVYASTLLVRLLTRPVLRLLQGYGPKRLRAARTAKRTAQVEKWEEERQELARPVHDGRASAPQRARYAALDARLNRDPGREELRMPTRVGNVLRTAETRPRDKYGLDVVALWPHLWLSLPEEDRLALAEARAALDRSVATVIWGLGFVAFGYWNPWAIPIGLLLALATHRWWLPGRAVVYADLLEAGVDLHRHLLYRRLRWPVPTDPDDERRAGARLTTYLVRGLAGTDPTFTTEAAS